MLRLAKSGWGFKEFWRRRLVVGAALACLTAAVGCGFFNGGGNNSGGSSTTPSFATTVVIGDSLSAGFQNGSLLDTQQPNGWASLVAKQANFSLTLPLMAPPGLPAVLQLTSLGPPPVVTQESGISTGRDDATVQATDLAVPGHLLNDLINTTPIAVPTTGEDIITGLILGLPVGDTKSQMNEAIALKPTALFVWIGSNDALLADDSGMPASMTPVATFTQEFTQLMTTLHSQTSATLIVGNIPDVTSVPYLTPAATLIAEVSTETGQPVAQVATELGIQAGDLVNATGLSQAQAAVKAIQQAQTPVPLTDAGFLDATEIAAVQSTITQYNTVISQQVTAVGGLVVDIHTFIQNLVQNGITLNNYPATTAFLGGLFSLDGVHPTNTGYALIANQFIDTMNTNLKTTIPDVDVSAVATADPLFGPNIKPAGAVVSIPLKAALQAGRMIAGERRRSSRDACGGAEFLGYFQDCAKSN
jgi:lysophospholipase L1-like esterase